MFESYILINNMTVVTVVLFHTEVEILSFHDSLSSHGTSCSEKPTLCYTPVSDVNYEHVGGSPT